MRSLKTIAPLALIAAGLSAAPAQARDPFSYYCVVSAGTYGATKPIAVTHVAQGDLSVDDLQYHFQSYLYDASKGRITVPFDTSRELHAYCVSGDDVARNSYIRYYGSLHGFPSPLDARGYWRRPKTGGTAKAVIPPASAKPKPVAPTAVASPPAPVMAPKGPTPNQLKYQRELAEHRARLDEIERIKFASAAKHSADRAAAAAELARHQREKGVADAAQRQYAADLAAHQALISQRETKQDRERKVDWREAVVVCNLNPSDGQSQFGNWRCDGPLQMTYAKLGGTGGLTPKELANLSDACGGKPESVRDLGTAGTSRIFGCSFGLHPKSTGGFPIDAAKKHGIGFVSGRAIYRCPEYVSACRTQ